MKSYIQRDTQDTNMSHTVFIYPVYDYFWANKWWWWWWHNAV